MGSKELLSESCQLRAREVLFVPHYPHTLFPTVSHRPGMDSESLQKAIVKAREGLFDGRRGAVVLARTTTDIVVTFPEDTELKGMAASESQRITALLKTSRGPIIRVSGGRTAKATERPQGSQSQLRRSPTSTQHYRRTSIQAFPLQEYICYKAGC